MSPDTLEIVKTMITNALADQRQEIYQELADSFKSAGELDLYSFQSIESQCSAHTARDLGDRISWLVES